MPIAISERFDSRQFSTGDNAGAEIKYVIVGTSDDQAAYAALQGAAPGAYQQFVLRTLDVEPLAPQVWTGSAKYGNYQNNPQAGQEPELSFDTTGGTQHITHSNPDFGTVGKYGVNGDTAPDNGTMIGAGPDGAEGCDIVVPVYQFGETHFFTKAQVTDAYRGVLYRLTGMVNNDTFRTCEAGEVLFLGASGTYRPGPKPWAISFKFAAAPNKYKPATDADKMRRQIVIPTGTFQGINPDKITVTRKNGWEYLWTRSIPKVIGSAETAVLTSVPRHAYVHPVYDASADFSELNIG
jgi:hypothetical protein